MTSDVGLEQHTGVFIVHVLVLGAGVEEVAEGHLAHGVVGVDKERSFAGARLLDVPEGVLWYCAQNFLVHRSRASLVEGIAQIGDSIVLLARLDSTQFLC